MEIGKIQSADRRRDVWLMALVGLLLLLHLVPVFGPMRFMNDTVSYLARAEHLAETGHLTDQDKSFRHPPGYSILLAGMIVGGLDSYRWFAAANFLLLAASLVAMLNLWRELGIHSRGLRLILIIVMLLSWVSVKMVPLLYSEILFLFLVIATAWVLECALGARWRQRVGFLAIASCLAVAATLTRTIGIALFPAIIWAAVGGASGLRILADRCRRNRPLVIGGIVGVGLFVATMAIVVFQSRYWTSYQFQIDLLPNGYLTILQYRILEWGKILINGPERAVPDALRWVFYPAGVALCVGVVIGIWRRRRRIHPSDVFLLCYAGLMMIWPWYDARFWYPVFPFLLVYLAESVTYLSRRFSLVRWSVRVYLVGFAAVGLAMLGLSNYFVFMGHEYPVRGRGNNLPAMRVAYGHEPEAGEDRANINASAVNVVRKYDPFVPEHLKNKLLKPE